MIAKRDTKTFGFLLLSGFPMACLTSAIEPLRAANEIAGHEAFSWRLLSEDGGKVTSSADVAFHPEHDLTTADDLDVIFVLSSPKGVLENERQTYGQLRYLARHGVTLGAISGGVFPLARAGVLDGHKCSVHWCYKTAFETEFPDQEISDDLVILGNKRYTASGAAAAFDMMLNIIEASVGTPIMTEVACWFQHPVIRAEGVRQRIPAFHTDNTADNLPDIVERAVQLFSENLEFTLSIQDVADTLNTSARQLERAFNTHLKVSPARYYRELRMRAAQQLVLYSNRPMEEIAHTVGYASMSNFKRNYKEQFSIGPTDERRKANRFRVEDNLPLPSV